MTILTAALLVVLVVALYNGMTSMIVFLIFLATVYPRYLDLLRRVRRRIDNKLSL
jgi:Flp pilus assembly protein TadB